MRHGSAAYVAAMNSTSPTDLVDYKRNMGHGCIFLTQPHLLLAERLPQNTTPQEHLHRPLRRLNLAGDDAVVIEAEMTLNQMMVTKAMSRGRKRYEPMIPL